MDEVTQGRIIDWIVRKVAVIAPDAAMRTMYGGVVIERIAGDPKTRIGGYYIYRAHVSLEFARGDQLRDPEGLLEGIGKWRRHLKLRGMRDIENKRCGEFLQQALA